jgi:hypothetical protein
LLIFAVLIALLLLRLTGWLTHPERKSVRRLKRKKRVRVPNVNAANCSRALTVSKNSYRIYPEERTLNNLKHWRNSTAYRLAAKTAYMRIQTIDIDTFDLDESAIVGQSNHLKENAVVNNALGPVRSDCAGISTVNYSSHSLSPCKC